MDEKAVNIYFEDMKGDKNLTEVILQAVTTCKAEGTKRFLIFRNFGNVLITKLLRK